MRAYSSRTSPICSDWCLLEFCPQPLDGDRDSSRSFAAFYLRDGVVIAVDAVNRAPEFMLGKRLISGRVAVDTDKLADDEISMKAFLPQ